RSRGCDPLHVLDVGRSSLVGLPSVLNAGVRFGVCACHHRRPPVYGRCMMCNAIISQLLRDVEVSNCSCQQRRCSDRQTLLRLDRAFAHLGCSIRTTPASWR
ncbi:hypothetical protein, partial [Methylobacterium oryzisoli]|uniref:hypothetical protein n=1 Tax=Methylobacterium oryzisoli TaxID=3385502 RepID=UPI003891B88F